jgi:2-aminoadipate transaminase
MDLTRLYTKNTLSMKSSMIRELVSMTKGVPGLISFAGGFPSPKTFPKEDLARIYNEVVTREGDEILQYGTSGGEESLKAAILKQENLHCGADEIMICSGATNGIYYLTRTLIEPGDVIISESPSFLGSLVSFEALGAEVIPVSMESDGMNLSELDEVIDNNSDRSIKLIYTIPDFQNPTGITMSRAKREKLIKIAQDSNILVLEDDPYSKLRFKNNHEESLHTIANKIYQDNCTVVSVRSFSKLLGPGLRIAYTLAHPDLIKQMISWSQKINVTSDRVTQRVVAKYLEEGLLADHVEKIKKIYQPLGEEMISSLQHYMPEKVKWTEPEGGMFVWITLPETENTDELFKKALQEKVAFIPGSKFYPSNKENYNGLRLNFSYPSKEQIREGIKRLANACCHVS